MKAIELKQAGEPLQVIDRPTPEVRPDGVLIRVKAAPVISYMKGIFSGELPYMLPSEPFIPGPELVGTVEAVGSEVFDLEPGTLVYAGSHIASRGYFREEDSILIGHTGMTPLSPRVQNIWRDGGYAEFAHFPVDCVTPLSEIASVAPEKLASIIYLACAYGGLLAAELKPAEKVIIGGATGNFGAHGVLMALAMGASRVIPMGRNAEILETLKAIDPKRVFPAVLTGNVETDTETILAASNGPSDCFYDIVGGGGTDSLLAGLRAMRNGGRLSVMGALDEAIQIPYVEMMVRELTIRGNFMYPPEAVGEIARMIAAGTIDLNALDITKFNLVDAAAAVEDATGKRGLSFNVLMLLSI